MDDIQLLAVEGVHDRRGILLCQRPWKATIKSAVKKQIPISLSVKLVLLTILCFVYPCSGSPPDYAFTYQGRLAKDGVPAAGLYDLKFVLYTSPVGGNHWWRMCAEYSLMVRDYFRWMQ